ncbi:MAG: peptidylprolyl isomerase [Verrucomicrobiales bacterium]
MTKEGADFAQMAKSYSQDSKSTDGGDWGWIDKRQLNKQLSEVAFSLSANQVSDIIEDATNYYLITLDAKKEGEVKTLDDPEVREQAEKRVMQEERKKRHDKWLERLRSKAIIKIYDK